MSGTIGAYHVGWGRLAGSHGASEAFPDLLLE